MRLDEITIEKYKNLNNLHVDFDETSPYTVLVGENGSGKSNLIEALAYIFRNLDLNIEAPFGYHLKYQCRGADVEIKAKKDETPEFFVKQKGDSRYKPLNKSKFMAVDAEDRPLFRPAFVFGYYSGPNDRLASLFTAHNDRFYKFIIKPRPKREKKSVNSNALRRLFYAQNLHGQFALLAFFMESSGTDSDRDRKFLRENLQIDDLDSVLFALKRPPWRRTGGDERFWNAEGEVSDFLGHLYEAALLPMRLDRRVSVDLTNNPQIEHIYLFLQNTSALESVYNKYNNQYAFFTALESTYMSKLLSEVRTRVQMTSEAGGTEVTYRDLSEGEQQLLLVLGLLKFTAEDETLFLLDEPDTHLNPAWSTEYLGFLDQFIQHRASCHIVMTTHDPLVFSRLLREQVRIMRRLPNGDVIVDTPMQNPRGMGVEGILTSDLFRLRTALDPETQNSLDAWRRLSLKEVELTENERRELSRLSTELRQLGMTQTIRDPLYQLFLKAWTEYEDPSWSENVELTPEQLVERDKLAARIVADIRRKQG